MQNKMNLFLSVGVVLMSTLCFGMEDVPLAQLPQTITIQTSDEQTFEVPRDLYRFSGTITNMVADCGNDLTVVPLPNVSADVWNIICSLLIHVHKNQLDTLKTELMGKDVPELSKMITTANYLNIQPLIDVIENGIAQKLSSKENRNQFLSNGNFLADTGLSNLPAELSVCVAQKILQRCPEVRNYLLNRVHIPLHILRGHSGSVNSVCVEGNRIISGSVDNTVRVWNIQTGECEHVLEGHTDSVWSVCVQGNRIISGSYDNTIRVWDMAQFNSLKRCLGRDLTIEQALMLMCIDDAIEQNQKVNITFAHMRQIYESLPGLIKDIVQQQDAQGSSRSWWNSRTVATGVAALSVAAGLGWTVLRNMNRR